METIYLTTAPEDAGTRIDSYLSSHLTQLTRSAAQRLCEEGMVLADGGKVAKNFKLRGCHALQVTLPPPKSLDVVAQSIPLDIVFEDDDLLVVNKPKGMVVHPAPGNEDGTLVNALLHHCGDSLSGIGGVARPGIVHRIDKDTSGLLAVAKTDLAHQGLSRQIKAHTFTRIYHAVVHGKLKKETGRIETRIGRHPADRKKMCVTDNAAREAVTLYSTVEELNGFTHVLCRLETGRTHQIRVHMAYVGHPVAGDPVYGPKSKEAQRLIARLQGQCLHAQTLGFLHPRAGAYMEFTAPLPDYFTRLLDQYRTT